MTRTFKRAFILLLDGARPDFLRELAAAGRLPNIARHFIERGTAADAVTVFPSTTGPAHLPYLTGRFPGPCNVPGIRWFDRATYARDIVSASRFRSYMGLGSLFIGRDIAPSYPQTACAMHPHPPARSAACSVSPRRIARCS